MGELASRAHVALREQDVEQTFFRATAGNPLFILETIACVATRGLSQLPRELEQLPLAEGVAAVVRARMASLSPAARRALETASLLGREVAIERWASAADMPEDLLRERATEIVASGVLQATEASRWIFSHDLVREGIVREVPADLARAAHRRVALTLHRRIEAGDRSLSGERLHHALGALGALDADVVLRWATEASEDARAQCAYEQALAILQRTVAALGPGFTPPPVLLLALGRAHFDVGNVKPAREALRAALDSTRASGDVQTHALAVLAFGSRYVLGDIHDDLVRMIDEASEALGTEAVELRARLLARKAAALTPAKRPSEVLAMAREAFRMVSGSNDDGARLDVCVGVGSAFGDFAHPRERIPVNDELVRLARLHGDRALELRGLSRLVTDHMEAGDFRRAAMLLPERDDLARALKQPRFAWMTPLFRSMHAMAEGRFDVCEEAISQAASLGVESGDANAARCVAVHRMWMLFVKDDVEAMTEHEPQVLEALRSMPHVLSSVVRAVVRHRARHHAACSDEVAALDPTLPSCAVNTMAMFAEVVAEHGPPDVARALIERLSPHADTLAIWGLFGLTCGPPVAVALGRLEAAFGDRARAIEHFDFAVNRATTTGARALRAWARHAQGYALIAYLGDPRRGRALLEEAADEATALGMGLAKRCRDALETAAPAPRPQVAREPEKGAPTAWTLRQEGAAWRIDRGGRTVLVPALRGLPMLERLLATPDTEIHSLELVSGTPFHDRRAGDAGEHLDDRARAAYKKRAAELSERIAEAEERGDATGADVAHSELDALRRELSRAVGLGGRTRRAGAAAERARISAQRRIREAIRKIRDVDPELGDYLERTIKTGVFCVYAPRRRNRS